MPDLDPLGTHLRLLVQTNGSVAETARVTSLARTDLSRALNHAHYPPRLLAKLGWERVTTYRPITPAQE